MLCLTQKYLIHSPFLIAILSQKKKERIILPKMANQNIPCLDDCPNYVLAMQASTRNTLSSCLVTSLNSLLAAERYLKGIEMPGWNPMNANNVKLQIKNAEKAQRKSANDLKYLNDIEDVQIAALGLTKLTNFQPNPISIYSTLNKWILPY